MNAEDCARALEMIRHDELVGEGSCSCIDETYTDLELMIDIIEKAETPTEALEIAHRVHRTFEEIQNERRAERRYNY